MNPKKFERILATLVPFGATAIDQTARSLRPAGLLPVGGRGFAAVDITPHHAANMLIGLAAAERPGQAAYAVVAYRSLAAEDGASFEGCRNFGDALSEILADLELALKIRSVVICQTRPLAFIESKDGTRVVFGADDSGQGDAEFRIEARIGSGILEDIAFQLAEPIDDEWTAEA